MFRYEYLSDSEFLKQIDLTKNKTQYVKIIIMNWRDEPIATVEGKATGGSISVNGSSSIRRQGNLTMIATPELYDITNIDNLLSINKRVAIEIGFKNIWGKYENYPVIWFPQGIFVLSQAIVTKNINSFNISLTLKDKMTLLNGENGGILPTMIVHHPMENELGESIPVNVRDILYTLLTIYGQIPEEKILIDNIPLRIKNAVRLIKSAPIYSVGGYESDFRLYTAEPSIEHRTYEFNDNVGYIYTDFTYPAKELTSNPGETITSVLDKIKNTLGNYEYFFDINGVFRFQEIQNFINDGSVFNNWEEAINEKYLINTKEDVSHYNFNDTTLLTALSNTPLYSAIKNDIVIWGAQNDTKISIRYHLIIDYKPEIDTSKQYTGVLYKLKDKNGVDTGPYRFGPKSLLEADLSKIHIIKQFDGEATEQEPNNNGEYLTLGADTDWRIQEYIRITSEKKQDFLSLEIKEELPKLMNIDFALRKFNGKDEYGNDTFIYFGENRTLWNHVLEDGTADTGAVTWFLDILDVNKVKSLEWMAISNIGRREKVLNDKSVNCLFAPNYQNIILIKADGSGEVMKLRNEAVEKGENYTQVEPMIYDMLGIGINSCAAYDILRSMLHEITGYNESISLTTVPIYHLEPNIRIYVNDNDTGIHGDYMIKTFSVPFTVGGAMTLSCQKAVERI